ncbi:MAG: M28 family peptidase [Clostridia bacterium]|nr:M28 family peptidase [Clostridia bacterium]
MTKLKKIYYPIIAVVFAIALALGFVSSYTSIASGSDKTFVDNVRAHAEVMERVHNSYEELNQENVRNYIKNTLVEGGIYNGGGSKNNDYETATTKIGENEYIPSYVMQKVELSEETFSHLGGEDDIYYLAKELVNIVVAIPGKSEEAILFTANYDSAAKSQSGTEGIQAAAMLQTVLELAEGYENGQVPDKTLLFVFTDAEHEGALGAYAFRYQFKGFDGIVDKVALAVNFGANGTGTLAVESDKIAVSKVRANAGGLYGAINKEYEGVSDYDVMGGAKINVFFTGNKSWINTSRDTIENVSSAKIKTIGGVMNALVKAYGFSGDGQIGENNTAGAFSYMGLGFSYSSVVSYVLGGVIIALIAAAIYIMFAKGKKLGVILKGALNQIITLAVATAIMFVCYFVLVLLLAGFGAVPINALIAVTYMNAGLFVACMLLALAAYIGSYLIVRKFYGVKATDAARGGALIIMLLGAVMSFAMPNAAMPFAIAAILEGAALIVTSLLGGKFKDKFSADIERLFIYTLPLIVLTPAMLPIILNASYAFKAVYLPIIMAVVMLAYSVIAPYFTMLKPALTKLFAMLPKHTIRVEKVVTEKVEGAKKGRFEERTTKKVVNEKVEWSYRNRYGVAILAIFAAFLVVMFAVCPANKFDTNIVNTYSYREAVKDNSLVYHWKQEGTSAAVETLRVYDQVAYSYFGTIDKDYSYNPTVGAYEKTFTGSSSSLGTISPISIVKTGNSSLVFTPFDNASDSIIDIVLSNISGVTKITIETNDGKIELENDGLDTMRIELPYDENTYGSFTITFEYEKSFSIGVNYTQYVSGERTEQRMRTLTEYEDVRSGLSDKDFAEEISSGMIFNRVTTISMT